MSVDAELVILGENNNITNHILKLILLLAKIYIIKNTVPNIKQFIFVVKSKYANGDINFKQSGLCIIIYSICSQTVVKCKCFDIVKTYCFYIPLNHLFFFLFFRHIYILSGFFNQVIYIVSGHVIACLYTYECAQIQHDVCVV